MELQNYSRYSFIPSSSDEPFIKVIEATFRNDREQESPISLIEMSGHQLIKYCEDLFAPAEFRTEENSMRFAELGLDSDETDSLKNLRIIKSYVHFPVPKPKWTDKLTIWLNS